MLIYISAEKGKETYNSDLYSLDWWYTGFKGRDSLKSWPGTYFITIF